MLLGRRDRTILTSVLVVLFSVTGWLFDANLVAYAADDGPPVFQDSAQIGIETQGVAVLKKVRGGGCQSSKLVDMSQFAGTSSMWRLTGLTRQDKWCSMWLEFTSETSGNAMLILRAAPSPKKERKQVVWVDEVTAQGFKIANAGFENWEGTKKLLGWDATTGLAAIHRQAVRTFKGQSCVAVSNKKYVVTHFPVKAGQKYRATVNFRGASQDLEQDKTAPKERK